MNTEWNDQVLQCQSTEVHPPHMWFNSETFPDGYRCYGVPQSDLDQADWPPKTMETKELKQ